MKPARLHSRLLLTAGFALILLCAVRPGAAATYDVSRDFLTSANPGVAWSYGWKTTNNGAFSLLPHYGAEAGENGGVYQHWQRLPSIPASVYRNGGTGTMTSDGGQGVYPPGTVWFGAGANNNADNFGVIRFTVPSLEGGLYRITTAVASRLNGSLGGDSDFHLMHNGGELYARNISLGGTAGYTNELVLAAGDTIDFMAGRGLDGTEFGGGLKISATLTLVSPPGLSIRVSQVELCWPTKSNTTYRLLYREEVGTNGWVTLGGTVAGTGSKYCTNDFVLPGQPRRFYRLSEVNVP